MSDADRSLVQQAAAVTVEIFEWIKDSLASDAARRAILLDLGMEVSATPSLDLPQERLDSIGRYRQKQDADFAAFISAWGDIVALLEAIDVFISAAPENEIDFIEDETYRLATMMGTDYMRLKHPVWFFGAQLARVVVDRPEKVEKALEFLESELDANVLASATLLPLAVILAYFADPLAVRIIGEGSELPKHLQLYGWDRDESSPTPVADELSEHMLSILFEGKRTGGDGTVTGKLGATLAWIPEEHGGRALFLALHGSDEITAAVSDNWRMKVKFASAGAVDFLIGTSVTVNGPSDASAAVTLETSRKTEQGPYVLGFAKGTRLEIGKVTISAQLGAAGASIKAVAKDSAMVMTVAEADPFVEKAIPAGEVRFDFDLGLGVSNDRGLFLEGGSGLKLSLPLNRTVGPVRLRQLLVALGGGSTGKALQMEFLATLDVKLGPVTATLDRLGFAVAADPKDRDPPSMGYKGPSGIGLVIDRKPVKGSGYLLYDPEAAQYAGAVQLDVDGLTLQAVGLITTKMPDGSRGFSLLVIVSAADFTPISLPFGFRLTGVGG
jgi:hypothetical protein